MKIFLRILFLFFWLTIGFLDGGAWNAKIRAEFPDLLESPHDAHELLGESILAVILGPVAFPAIAIVTRFYSDGISYDFTPFPCTRTPEIWCK